MIRSLFSLSVLLLASALLCATQSSNNGSSPTPPAQPDAAKAPPPSPSITQKPAPTNPPEDKDKKKAKKVWTEEEIGNLKSTVSVVGGSSSGVSGGNSGSSSSRSGARNAEWYRQRLAPLRAELDDAEQQIQEVKKYGAQAGRYNNMSLDALEDKRKSIQRKIDVLQDEARKDGIDPGELR